MPAPLQLPENGLYCLTGADLVFVALAGVVAGLAGAWVALWLRGRAMDRITGAVQEIARGNFVPWIPLPNRGALGRLSLAVGVMADEVRRLMSKLERNNRIAALGEIAAHLAHEIRNPLSSIKLNLQSLERELITGEIPPDGPAVVKLCLREVSRLDTVVRGILELARPPRANRTLGSLSAILLDGVDLMRGEFRRRGIAVEIAPVLVNDRVLADREILKGAFLNLLLNALDAMSTGGTLRIWTQAVGDRAVRVHLRDTGHGVQPELRESIFEAFFTTKRDGTGIGLPLALRAVEEHGGRLYLEQESELEPGAHFVVELPRAAEGEMRVAAFVGSTDNLAREIVR